MISLSPPQDDAPQEEWEDWDTMTVTVVPNNPPTDEGSGDPRMKYSTRQASSTENEPSAEELFHDMQPVYKKAKMVLFLQILAVYCIWDPILKSPTSLHYKCDPICNLYVYSIYKEATPV